MTKMRYLKTYKIFESSDFSSIKDDISDMLLEISDEGLEISFSETEHHTMSKAFEMRITKGQTITEDEYYHGGWESGNWKEYQFKFTDSIESGLYRIFNYLNSNGWDCFDSDVISLDEMPNLHRTFSKRWGYTCLRTDISLSENGKFYMRNIPVNGSKIICIHAGFGRD